MNRTTRTVAAAVLAAVVALGAVAPAVAAPQGGPGKPDKVAVKVEKQKPVKDRAAKKEQRLERMANRKASYLERLTMRNKVTRLGEVGGALAANMLTDAGVLDGLVFGEVEATETEPTETTETEPTAEQLVRSARPVVYHRVINQARLIVVNELGDDLLAEVLEFDAWTPKSDLKAKQLEIAGLLAEIEDEPELENELEDDPEAETTDESEESGEA